MNGTNYQTTSETPVMSPIVKGELWREIPSSAQGALDARLLGFLPLPFAQAYPGPTAVFIDELNAGGLQRAANC
jgi:hypothetical protein